ncbi:MAG: GNAT family N-acetyltransferase [Ilumatobacteraceae bacterium]
MVPHVVDFVRDRARFLKGLEVRAHLPPGALGEPGTSVTATDDRVGTGAISCYRVDEHLVIWCDPALEDRVAHLSGPQAIAPDALPDAMSAVDLRPDASAAMRALITAPAAPPPLLRPLVTRTLDAQNAEHVDRIRAFAARLDPIDVEQAGLDDLDDFDEAAIAIVVDERIDNGESATSIIAYASAMPWEWDGQFGDIAVLVDGTHRGAGLGRHVVARTTAALLDLGRIPLYRHQLDNAASAAVAASIGFQPLTSLVRFRAADE